jgi:hypothetical protein
MNFPDVLVRTGASVLISSSQCPLASCAQAAKLWGGFGGRHCTRICASPVRVRCELQACAYACLIPVEMPAPGCRVGLGAPRLLAGLHVRFAGTART